MFVAFNLAFRLLLFALLRRLTFHFVVIKEEKQHMKVMSGATDDSKTFPALRRLGQPDGRSQRVEPVYIVRSKKPRENKGVFTKAL